MGELMDECLNLFNLKQKKSVLEMTLEERELYKVCTQTEDNNVIVVDGEPMTPEKLAKAVEYLKKRKLKFVVLT
jgi:uracil phosphoribosyltransferase